MKLLQYVVCRNGQAWLYTCSEFHYLHHDKKGKSFENIAEMGSRLIQAAKNAGINITLIPIFYQKGGFSKEATTEQRRFISNNIDAYISLFEASKSLILNEPHASIGLGIHSMRAVETDNIIKVSNFRHDHIPFHIHVSEQIKEVEDSLHFLKQDLLNGFQTTYHFLKIII